MDIDVERRRIQREHLRREEEKRKERQALLQQHSLYSQRPPRPLIRSSVDKYETTPNKHRLSLSKNGHSQPTPTSSNCSTASKDLSRSNLKPPPNPLSYTKRHEIQLRTSSNELLVVAHTRWTSDTNVNGEIDGSFQVPQLIHSQLHHSPACSSVSMSQPSPPTPEHARHLSQNSFSRLSSVPQRLALQSPFASERTISSDVGKELNNNDDDDEEDWSQYFDKETGLLKSNTGKSQPNRHQPTAMNENCKMVSEGLLLSSDSESEDDSEEMQRWIQAMPSKNDLERKKLESASKPVSNDAWKENVTLGDDCDSSEDATSKLEAFPHPSAIRSTSSLNLPSSQTLSTRAPCNPLILMKRDTIDRQSTEIFIPSQDDDISRLLWSDDEAENVAAPPASAVKARPKSRRKSSLQGRAKGARSQDETRDDASQSSKRQIQFTELELTSTRPGPVVQHPDVTNINEAILHPSFDKPQFGPFELEPLILNEVGPLQVPASICRYLLPYQREGIRQVYNCLVKWQGCILGDGKYYTCYRLGTYLLNGLILTRSTSSFRLSSMLSDMGLGKVSRSTTMAI
jgi:hypothetical protein